MTEQSKDTPIRKRASGLALKIITALLIGYTFYFCRSLILPILLAGFFALFASPAVHTLTALKVPKPVAAVVVISLLLVTLGYGLSLVYEPAASWMERLPTLAGKVANKVDDVADSVESIKETVLPDEQPGNDTLKTAMGSGLVPALKFVAETAALVLVQFGAIVMLTYFFLVFGETLMRNLVKAQRSFGEKKHLVGMFQAARGDISRYVMVVSVINIMLGLATAGLMTLLGVQDPLLWGALATILNFAPYVGPMVLIAILAAVGFLEYDTLSRSLMLPGSFFILNLVESQLVTPLVLGQRFNMNPLLLVLWMFIWGWIWGVVGVLIAIPMLVCIKIFASHIKASENWLVVLDAHSHDASSVNDNGTTR